MKIVNGPYRQFIIFSFFILTSCMTSPIDGDVKASEKNRESHPYYVSCIATTKDYFDSSKNQLGNFDKYLFGNDFNYGEINAHFSALSLANKLSATQFLVQHWTGPQLEPIWSDISTFYSDSDGDWQWSLGTQAVICGNHSSLSFLLERGLDPEVKIRGTSDLMLTAISLWDLESAKLLFEAGYQRCEIENLEGDKVTLLKIAERAEFRDEFHELFIQYCGG